MDGGHIHNVTQGDSTTRIAFRNGHFWETLWNHPENSKLKSDRKDPNILLEGDELFVPELRTHEEPCATEKKHRFRRKGVPEYLNIQFFDLYREPFANKPYTLEIDGEKFSGTLDGEGWLRHPISPDALAGNIKIGRQGELADIKLQLGHLDPIDQVTGVKGRLRNLGFYKGPIDEDDGTEEFKSACTKFRVFAKLPEGDEIDGGFLDKLKNIHNS